MSKKDVNKVRLRFESGMLVLALEITTGHGGGNGRAEEKESWKTKEDTVMKETLRVDEKERRKSGR